MLYYQSGIVNTSFVDDVCRIFCTALTVLLIVVVVLGLHVEIQNTHHSIIELCYLTFQILLLSNSVIIFDTQRLKRHSIVCREANSSNAITVQLW
jgi:hypothetical protein